MGIRGRGKGTWHTVYGGLGFVFLLITVVVGSAALSSSTPTADWAWTAAVAVIAFAFTLATILFWLLAAANAAIIQRYYGQQIEALQVDHSTALERQGEQERQLRQRIVILLYELASEFSTRFAGHYFRTVVEHPEKEGNRRDFWVVVAFVSAMINEMGALGDTWRAELLRKELSRRFLDRRTAFTDAFGDGRKLLDDAKLVLGVVPSVKIIPTEYLAAARSTRLLEYVVDFATADTASS